MNTRNRMAAYFAEIEAAETPTFRLRPYREDRCRAYPGTDVRVTGGNIIFLVHPLSRAAREWVGENVEVEDWQWIGTAFKVHRLCLRNLVNEMRKAGFTVDV